MDYYSFNRPRRDGWLSWPCWLTDSGRFTHKVVTRPAVSLAQDRESSPARTSGLTTTPPTIFSLSSVVHVSMLQVDFPTVINAVRCAETVFTLLCRVLTVGGMELFPICKLLQDLLTTVTAVSITTSTITTTTTLVLVLLLQWSIVFFLVLIRENNTTPSSQDIPVLNIPVCSEPLHVVL